MVMSRRPPPRTAAAAAAAEEEEEEEALLPAHTRDRGRLLVVSDETCGNEEKTTMRAASNTPPGTLIKEHSKITLPFDCVLFDSLSK
jgi:hypothetical protein